MGPMAGGPVGGAPIPMMNNGAMPPQPAQRQAQDTENRSRLNTYIYEYFLRNNMHDCARALLDSQQPIQTKEGESVNSLGDDRMDTDSKDNVDSKRSESFPAPNVPQSESDSCFLYDWFCLFWDLFNAQRSGKAAGTQIGQYAAHTQVCFPLL